ncbi:thioredoxin fold domain-containing protein [Gilvimarinus xylanilyticus]|uniref:Thiol:disulfide interchange protein n=1 Tax=Gilvimarinus xylanilyticus TaxID=2944139 RepID=A0A9X2I318_9GAMM|nr:thioredoxin fold domain-containing protein [Gilvimarinus xylanilyticus]MCP8898007.1 thioredoxin fold domain-containing protein [Gilvimarinus xylanilyticus]
MIVNAVRTSIAALAFAACASVAQDSAEAPANDASQPPEQVIKAQLDMITGGAQLGPVRPSVIEGLYNVQVIGGPSLMVSADGKYAIMGDAYTFTAAGLEPVQDPYLLNARKEFVSSLKPGDTIDFAPDDETKHVAYVFTDVDCGYCRRLHSQMDDYNDEGIEIRYLAYPRAGENSPSAAKLESAWCADDPNAALDKLKNLEDVEPASCDAPIAQQFLKGGELGVTGTPSILLPDGRLFVGYLPPDRLLQNIEQE